MFIGGQAFSIHRINGAQWGYSIVLGALSMPVAVIIRLIPDELFAKMIPSIPHRKKHGPEFVFEDDEDRIRHWNPALEEIREELTFLKKIRGGRMSELAYKLQHPRDTFLPRSRSPSRSRSNSELPQTPEVEQPVTDTASASPSTPEKLRRRARSTSSVFGPAAAMAGIIAGSVAGGWSPVEKRSDEQETVHFARARSHSGVEGTPGMEIHPATPAEDPVFAPTSPKLGVPPSQDPDLAPHFEHAPPHGSPHRPRASHSRQSSSAV